MKILKRTLSIMLVVSLMAGCAANQGNGDNQTDEREETENLTQTNNNDNENQTHMEVADEAAEKATDLEEVRVAYVIVANKTAYAAVELEEEPEEEIGEDVKQKISEEVKSTDDNIENVLVSANPDFVDRMTNYADKIENGQPVEGLFEEFNKMVQRVFPAGQ
ncbi:YhcN/YlaJ family sporulation lipoprotein [Alteribacillus sp. HJP-4]|uniref:YhcN/YlaJ family sporulation lipoprotein n=1 Tax=Alteribacillus sp. HJP-4 TaxID=2775394 RepID=UPI0035CD1D84